MVTAHSLPVKTYISLQTWLKYYPFPLTLSHSQPESNVVLEHSTSLGPYFILVLTLAEVIYKLVSPPRPYQSFLYPLSPIS